MKKKVSFLIAITFMFMIQLNQVMAYDNFTKGTKSCGKGLITDIPSTLVKVTNIVYTVLLIVVPILLVIFGSIDLIKAITSGKEDDIKKFQGVFVKRLITGALVFFVFVGVKLFISFVGTDRSNSKIISCVNCFLNNDCK